MHVRESENQTFFPSSQFLNLSPGHLGGLTLTGLKVGFLNFTKTIPFAASEYSLKKALTQSASYQS